MNIIGVDVGCRYTPAVSRDRLLHKWPKVLFWLWREAAATATTAVGSEYICCCWAIATHSTVYIHTPTLYKHCELCTLGVFIDCMVLSRIFVICWDRSSIRTIYYDDTEDQLSD